MRHKAVAGGPRERQRRAVAMAVSIGLVLAAAGIAPAMAGNGASPGPAPDDPVDRVLVRTTRPASDESEKKLAASVGGRHAGKLRPGVFAVEVNRGRGDEAAHRLKSENGVALAERDVRFKVAEKKYGSAGVLPNEECFVTCKLSFDGGVTSQSFSQGDMVRVGAPDAWAVTRGDPDMLVAVVDTDVDSTQPDLAGKVVVGRNFSGDSAPDPEGHGTAVAGIISAQPDNDIGIAGLGWSTRVLSVRVLDSKGAGLASSIAQGIRYAADYPQVKVINLSLQQDASDAGRVSTELSEAIAYAQQRGVVVTAAAGNQARTDASYPANFPGVISVGAVDSAEATASFSNRGTWVDLAAPGVGVLTVSPGCDCWVAVDGTSFATPFVSAAAALLLAVNPAMTPAQVATRLESTTDLIPGSGVDVRTGRLNVGRAVSLIAPLETPATDPEPAAVAPESQVVSTNTVSAPSPSPARPGPGYWLVASDGGIFGYGTAEYRGSTGSIDLNQPIVGMASTPSGSGYWLAAADGGIFAFGDAAFYGSSGHMQLNRPIVGMAATPSGRGYWLVASDGGIFAFGDAAFYGSTGNLHLNRPIVGMAPVPKGRGYWLVASDGGIFAFGDARFFGSTGAIRLNKPIVSLSASPTGRGYWLLASDGGVFNFGDAGYFGSAAGRTTNDVVAMAPTPAGNGYWIIAADGSVYALGSAPFLGGLGRPLNRPMVGLAVR